ncbi:MAG: hypothetical protein Q9162_004708 [Coniocarpon cinnabarinum]
MPDSKIVAWLKKKGLTLKHHKADREQDEDKHLAATQQTGAVQSSAAAAAGKGIAPAHHGLTLPPKITKKDLTRQSIEEAIEKANGTLGKDNYALIGGVGCHMMGSERTTADFDFLVPNGDGETMKTRLEQTDGFGRSPGFHLYFTRTHGTLQHGIDVVTAEQLSEHGHLPNLESSMIQRIGNVNVAKPQVMLLYKSISYILREKVEKKHHDMVDIIFLLEKCVSRRRKEKEKAGR